MAFLTFSGVGLAAVSACVPRAVGRNADLAGLVPPAHLARVIASTGIREKRLADDQTCASDLCAVAAERLIEDLALDRSRIDVLIFLSQTPDHRVPATAPALQHRLGLSRSTAAFDMDLNGSAYVYGLSTAFAYASQPGIDSVLLLVGDTFSKLVSPRDKVNAPLYGDAGTATLIQKSDRFGSSVFALGSDGSGAPALVVPASGCRTPPSAGNLVLEEQEDGNLRGAQHVHMDAVEVFSFTAREVARNVTEVLERAGVGVDQVDHLVLHQANKFMTDFIAGKLKFPLEKVPCCLDRYGNTSSCSIPLTISSELQALSRGPARKVLLSGFGAGLSWGACLLALSGCAILPVAEYGSRVGR